MGAIASTRPDWSQVQAFVRYGFPKHAIAGYYLLNIESREGFQALLQDPDWLALSDKSPDENRVCANLAFTAAGLQVLMGETLSWGFVREFLEGMTDETRSRALGDIRENAPGKWLWGGPNGDEIHALLLLFGKDRDTVGGFFNDSAFSRVSRCVTAEAIWGNNLPKVTKAEHFGFRDGISQPEFVENGSPIAPGEFVLGCPNELKQYPLSPFVAGDEIAKEYLGSNPASPFDPSSTDLGVNGTYVVMRQLEQYVGKFWRDARAAAAQNPDFDCVALASRMVGRWPDGSPLTVYPERPPAKVDFTNDFRFRENDADGLRCPLGSHIRRANPRDSLEQDLSAGHSLDLHRLLRRGRMYGQPIPGREDQKARLAFADRVEQDPDLDLGRGLIFICLNANIERQFEFVQRTWVNGPKFAGLSGEVDPLVGGQPEDGGVFTVQATPCAHRFDNISRFTKVVGGAYFFLPGLNAIRYLGHVKLNGRTGRDAS